jgi:hypothetical protein
MSSPNKIYLYRGFAAGVYLSEAQKPITPLHTVYVYTVYLFTQSHKEGGQEGRAETERRL